MRKKLSIVVAMSLGICLLTLVACGSSGSSSSSSSSTGTVDATLAGNWRVLSEIIYFTNGLVSPVDVTEVTTLLVLDASGSWQFGSSSGTWGVSDIVDSDWTTWGTSAYGPTRKITLNGWNNSTSTGPIDETNGVVDYLWAIYGYTSDTNGPGTMWMKFGRSQ